MAGGVLWAPSSFGKFEKSESVAGYGKVSKNKIRIDRVSK
jgi:hypothetical protein